MQRSEKIDALATALVTFQGKVSAIKKDANNPFFKSKYASLENIIETIRKPLSDEGLSVAQFPSDENKLVTILMHKSGQFIEETSTFHPTDNKPQSLGSAITYMRRYALSAVLGLATEEDDDGNAASAPDAPKKPATRAPIKPLTPRKTLPTDPFEAAKVMIKKAKTVDDVLSISEKVDASDKFTDEKKLEIKKIASQRVDSFDNMGQ